MIVMSRTPEIGLTNRVEITVTNSVTAAEVGSGDTLVFATPSMIALMEKTASLSVADYLDEESTTVGTELSVEHLAATPVGMKVYCISKLEAVEGRKLTFSLEVYDETGVIGRGSHGRFIVNRLKFQGKADAKLK